MQKPDAAPRLTGVGAERPFWVALGLSGVLHGVLFVWSLARPGNYLQGDRAFGRFDRIQRLLEAESILDVLIETGGPGDYIFHGILWKLGGAPLTIGTQVVLLMFAVAALYWLARIVSVPPWAAAIATLVYVLLPSSIHQPHTLVSEGFFVPFVLFSFCFLARCLTRRRNAWADLICFGLCASLASFVRPVFIAIAPLLSVSVFANGKRAWRHFVLINVIALSLPLTWGFIQYKQTGRIELGGKGHGLGVNLLGRMKRMEARGGAPLRHELHERKDADPWTFIVYAAENPKPFVATLGVDGFHMTLNTGINHVGGRFFGWFEMPSDGLYWRQVNDERGIPGVVGELMRRAPTMIVLNAAALILWTGFLALVGAGVFALLSANQRTTAIYMLLLIAGFAFVSLSASAVRFGLRSPMEFALAVFFGAGLTELGRRLRT